MSTLHISPLAAPLTEEEKTYCSYRDGSSDPLLRLGDNNRYYILQRQDVLFDYVQEMESTGGELDQIDEAVKALDRRLAKLQADYVRDLEQLAEILVLQHGVWNPFKFRCCKRETFVEED